MSVGTGWSSQSAETRSRTRSLASTAGDPARAAASAASTRAVTWAWEVALPVTEPVATPPSGPGVRMKEITVTLIPCITPFVVSVLLAQRRLALVLSLTITMQSSAVDVATAWSTRDCGVTGPEDCSITGHLPRWC
jgi:hypothetical protein